MASTENETTLVRTATVALRALATGFFALAAFVAWRLPGGIQVQAAGMLEFWGALVLAGSFLVSSFLPASSRIGAAIATCIFAAGLLAIDAYLSRTDIMMPEVANARRLGVQFDDRLLKDVVLQRRAKGEAVTLAVFPTDYLFGFGEKVILSNPPLSKIVLCNELGSFETIESDEYGFNNPRGTWGTPGVDVMLLGDSYVEGFCVPREDRLAEIVRKRYPATVNVGRGGLGPLGALAMLREYGPAVRPKVIVWSYFDNDWDDLRTELQVPTLLQYLRDQAFTQHLHARREQVNRVVTDFMERRIERLAVTQNVPFRGTRQFVNYWVPRLLERQDSRSSANAIDGSAEVAEQFTAVMREAQRVAEHLGAVLIFTHLRDFRGPPSEPAQRISDIVTRLGIPIVDLTDEVRTRFADPREMHRLTRSAPLGAPGNLIGHYNPQGHRLAGEVIARAIQARLDSPGHESGNGAEQVQ
jgi:hypothetical protein